MSKLANHYQHTPGTIRSGTHFGSGLMTILVFVIVMGAGANISAQSLNWEGQTGVFVTPLAYTVHSADKGLSLPVISYHYLDAGSVLSGVGDSGGIRPSRIRLLARRS